MSAPPFCSRSSSPSTIRGGTGASPGIADAGGDDGTVGALASAIKAALDGTAINLDGEKVGELVTGHHLIASKVGAFDAPEPITDDEVEDAVEANVPFVPYETRPEPVYDPEPSF